MTDGGPVRATDPFLMREVVAGSHDALAELYDRHADAVFASAMRLTSDRGMAEEVVQETFLALWDRAGTFDPGLGSLAAWLHTIARNRTVDRLRAAGRRPDLVPLSVAAATGAAPEADADALERVLAGGDLVAGAVPAPSPERQIALFELRDAIRVALGAMPEVERTVIVMAYGDDLSQSEIAERLGWPLGTVKTRTRRALARLRSALDGERDPSREGRLQAATPGGRDRGPGSD